MCLKPTEASFARPSVPRKSRSPSAVTRPPRNSMPRDVATAESVTPAHATSASRSMSPEHAKDRKSTRLNSSHTVISYAVFCLKKKKKKKRSKEIDTTTTTKYDN